MRPEVWEPLYLRIIEDMGYDRTSDENSARLLKNLTLNSNLITEDELEESLGKKVSIFGSADCLCDDIERKRPEGTLIAAGSATSKMMSLGLEPDIVVTDLDGDIDAQIRASKDGAIILIHAHGDNSDLIMRYAKEFTGPLVITTQSTPDLVLCNFGGFTDGDRAVCLADHFGAEYELYGFDFDNPSSDSKDPATKKRKLAWAKIIIDSLRG